MTIKATKRLLVIPSDPIRTYERYRRSDYLRSYFNPTSFFDEVVAIDLWENNRVRCAHGMKIFSGKKGKVRELIKSVQPTIIRAYGGYIACDTAVYNAPKNVPVVVSLHDTSESLLHHSLEFADAVICMADAVKTAFLKKCAFDKENIFILPNRIDTSIFHPQNIKYCREDLLRLPKKAKIILHVGRKSKQKNIETVLSAMKHLNKDYYAVFIGRGDDRKYKNIATDYCVNENCIWIENLQNEELPYWYSSCCCFVVPSLWEGFGIVFIEAAACGAPIITSNIAPLNAYLKNDYNAILLKDNSNDKELASAIERICNDDNFRSKLSLNAQKSMTAFAKDKVDRDEAKIYKDLITGKGPMRNQQRTKIVYYIHSYLYRFFKYSKK